MKFIRNTSFAVATGLGVLTALPAFAGERPKNLGGGLEAIHAQRLLQRELSSANRKEAQARRAELDALTEVSDSFLGAAFRDGNRVVVQVTVNNDASFEEVLNLLEKKGFKTTATDKTYRSGIIEGWMDLDSTVQIAGTRGVQAVILEQRPIRDVGNVTQQGVVQHRVDQINLGAPLGTGITIGALSDSYGLTTVVTPAADVASGDLPGTGNPLGNTQPVVILQDSSTALGGGADEGRGMLQVIHDMVPAARLGFATANGGAVNFARNIRALAGLPGSTYDAATQQGFKADIVVDDIIYTNEPMFSDGVVTKAVDDVNAAGVHYFSSAGNRPSTNGYASAWRPAPGDATSIAAASSINLTGVNAALYAGGFHNFRTDGSVDAAQTLRRTAGSGNSNRLVFQWDDPFDLVVPGTQVFSQSANFTGTTQDFSVALTSGTPTRVTAIAGVGSTFDAIVTILDPVGGTAVAATDTGTDETIFFTPTQTGNYTVRITAFGGTTGAYTVSAFANSFPGVSTQYNVLFFRQDTGAFISSFSTGGVATNQAIQSGNVPFPTGQSAIQVVFARGATANPQSTRLRYVLFDSSTATTNPSEYVGYQYPITYGHNTARNGFGVAAYSAFRPRIPESFTSPGPMVNYFDAAGNRLATPEVRLKPDIAAMDGANNTFFTSDTPNDADTFPNFFGTSCAAPNAAACAGIVLQAKGGSGSLTIGQMKSILQSTALMHDLDPYYARTQIRTATGGKLTIQVNADPSNSSGGQTVTGAAFDTTVVAVNYVGPGAIKTLNFDMTQGNTTGGNETVGRLAGLVWDPRAVASGGLPFTLGTLTGLASGDIVSSFTGVPPTPPAAAGQFQVLTLTFTDNVFTGGKGFTFNCDRDELRPASLNPAQTSAGGNSADLWGANVEIPGGVIQPGGVQITGTMQDGTPFTGRMVNAIGRGYSPLDGFGFIDAAAAAAAPVPAP